ncbi:MAG: PQQ-binding-like beta-propeller repeat protein [Candidatus Hinthialibacter antarcticus]|nr:PQQ-binding-like beta-propeller repeat protein [Candidatus Hinthialibacter antarcticus]
MNNKNRFQFFEDLWDSSAKNIAVVAAIYCILVAGFLAYNYAAAQSGLPEKERIYSQQMAEKKALLIEDVKNEELKSEIRDLDLALRQQYFERMAFSKRGKYLLLAGVIVLLLALKKTVAMQKKLPKKRVKNKDPLREANATTQARQTVIGSSIVLLAGALALGFAPGVDLPSASDEAEQIAEAAPQVTFPTQEEIRQNWSRFRGPGGVGVAHYETAPTTWDGESGDGIIWKTEVLLEGNNSPIVWGDRLFMSGADENTKEIFCYSTEDGALLWRKPIGMVPGAPSEEPRVMEGTGRTASTMATDGARVYAIFFDGSLVAFDFDGNRVWAKNLGVPDSVYGYATSLMCYQDKVIVQYDQGYEDDDTSVLYAFDGKTGSVVWQTVRPVANSWTSPILAKTNSGEQIITVSEPWVIGYKADSGEELWRATMMGTDLAPSPVIAKDMAIVIQPNEWMAAIKTDGSGDVTESHVAWHVDCMAPDIGSPVTDGELIWLLTTMGTLSCHKVETGEMLYEHEMDDMFQSSPVLVGEWIYMMSEKGKTYRVKTTAEFEQAEEVPFIDEWILASPAFTQGRIFVRGDRFLYCLGSK